MIQCTKALFIRATRRYSAAATIIAAQDLAGISKSKHAIKPLTYPTFGSVEEERQHRKERMAAAFRVFAKRGYDEGVAGHISVRDPEDPSRFWLNPLAQHFSTIKASDLILVDETGEILEGDRPVNRAAFQIHGAIHKHHSHVTAICHTHSKHARAFSAFGKELKMYNQDCCRFYKSHGVYRQFGGVVFTEEEGVNISKSLGQQNKILILQNHGIVSVGKSVDEAAFWFMTFEDLCETQLQIEQSRRAGFEPIEIGNKEAEYTHESIGSSFKGWLNFQGYYDEILKMTKGDFLK
ncbi:LAFE_0G10264g1_1 [Lachancea fermentati]|uniref:LAFE_0G10264g1_1 n=1 Tax=Lachancea fermentati TaxID=4955 RepID=A0A1G4MI55_LACFM|nr:LAFE_0G10264g1_1 [Lachancea fermentati]